MQRIWIEMKLPGLNEYVNACRSNPHTGAKLKKNTEQAIGWQIIKMKPVTEPVWVRFYWYESTKRRDKDNVDSAKKFIFDAMQKCGKLPNDNNKYIIGYDNFFIYGKKQGVLIEIRGSSEMEYKRLTDRDVAEKLKENVEGLKKAGIKPDTGDLRYIKLAEFENLEEMKIGKLGADLMNKGVVEK